MGCALRLLALAGTVANPLLGKAYGLIAAHGHALTCKIGRLYSPALFSPSPFHHRS